MKNAVFALSIALSTTTVLANQAREIMQKVDARDDGSSLISTMQMTLIDKKGQKRVRQMRTFSADIDENTEHRAIFFIAPSDVKNTAFLTYDYSASTKDDDQWMYLPALKKIKRIPSSDKDSAFMGSDFSYADMTDRELDDYTFKLIKQSKIKRKDGVHKVWVIESTPISPWVIDETGYTKSILYIRQDNFVLTRAKFYLKKGKRVKYMDVRKLEKINNIWVATQTNMTTKQGKQTLHKTVLKNTDVEVNVPINRDIFTLRALKKGV